MHRGVEPVGDDAVGGLAPQRLLGAVDGRGRRRRRTARRASRRGRAGPGPGRSDLGYQPFSSAIGWPSASRTRSSCQASASSARGPGPRRPRRAAGPARPRAAGWTGSSPRRRMSWLNDARCSRLSSRGRATNVPLPWIRCSSPSATRLVDGLAHRRPGHVVRRHQLALGGDRGVRRQLGRGQVGQRVAQLRVLGAGTVGDQRRGRLAGLRHGNLSTALVLTGTVWYVPVMMRGTPHTCQAPRGAS